MADSLQRLGLNQLNHKLKIRRGGVEITNGNISGSATSTGSFGQLVIGNGGDILLDEDQKHLIADAEISSSGINLDVYDGIELLGPFGSENPEPTFIIKSALLASVKILSGEHLKCLIKSQSGSFIEAMAFRSVSSNLGIEIQKNKGQTVSLFGKIKVNEWGGRRIPQFSIEDIADQIN